MLKVKLSPTLKGQKKRWYKHDLVVVLLNVDRKSRLRHGQSLWGELLMQVAIKSSNYFMDFTTFLAFSFTAS